MNDALHLKYLVTAPADLQWGMATNSVGQAQLNVLD